MKVATVVWHPAHSEHMNKPEDLLHVLRTFTEQAHQEEVDLLVCPGFTGLLYQWLDGGKVSLELIKESAAVENFLDAIKTLTVESGVTICPGIYWKKAGSRVIPASCLVREGELVLEQEQIYLAKWEREIGLARGIKQGITKINEWQIGIVAGTDVFYPQVSRALALQGVNLILSPIGFVGQPNPWLQVSGMWKEVQQNQFIAIESGFNGRLAELDLWGESTILAPVEMTSSEDGYLARSGFQDDSASYADVLLEINLDESQRQKAIDQFDVLKQLNPELYRQMGLFGVRK